MSDIFSPEPTEQRRPWNPRFMELLESVKRDGMDELKVWLIKESDFFTAPASNQYHGACEGGLVEHSLAVFDRLDSLLDAGMMTNTPIPLDSVVIVGLLHDICKANFYTIEYRNRKNESGQWEKYPYYAFDDKFPCGHGEKSVIILQKYIRLTDEEIMAIRWHMGLSDTDYGNRQSMSKAFNEYPLAVALHMADLATCYFDKK